MPRLHHLLTSLAFAAHALLGCGVHHVWQQGSAVFEHAELSCSHHGDLSHYPGHSPAPADHQPCPSERCPHIGCTFVKADTVRIDLNDQTASPVATPRCAVQASFTDFGRAECDVAGLAKLSSAHLYVWHCALLI